ncbi:hypothetical protein KC866_03935 [Patescibacteria group bacterium]|nr:hypothetical protein [Patescibacteria group bacterium]
MNEKTPELNSSEEREFQKRVKNEEQANLMKKGMLGMMLGASTLASSMDGDAHKEFNTLENTDGIETTFEKPVDSYEDAANPFNVEPDKDGVYENTEPDVETDPEKKPNQSETYKIDVMKSFGFEKPNLTPEDFEAGKSLLISQINELPDAMKQNLEVTVQVGRSPEPVVAGGYDTPYGHVDDLETLARYTAEEIGKMVQAAGQEAGVENIKIVFEIPEGGVDKNNQTRYGLVTFQENVATLEDQSESFENGMFEIGEIIKNNPEFTSIYESDVVILDSSGSMNEDMENALDFIKLIKEKTGKDIEVIDLEGKSNEAHARTLSKINGDVNALVITDEPDSTIQELFAGDDRRDLAEQQYKDYVDNEVLADSQANYKIRVLNPNAQEGGFKEFMLNDSPYAMMPLDKRGDKLSGGERIQKWYDGLPNQNITLENNTDIVSR